MTRIDVVVLLIGVLTGWAGWRSGGVRTLVGVLGRVLGVAAGLGVAHLIAGTTWSFGWRVAAEIAVVVIGLVVGGRVAHAVSPTSAHPSSPDRVVGVVVGTVAGVVVASAVLAGFAAGYPGGGPLQAGWATVLGGVALPAAGSSGVDLRPAYRLAADVRPGNSGGPVERWDSAPSRSCGDAGPATIVR